MDTFLEEHLPFTDIDEVFDNDPAKMYDAICIQLLEVKKDDIPVASIIIEDEEDEYTCDMFTCGKCGTQKTKYYTKQTRSADEPETIFITCENGHRWRQ